MTELQLQQVSELQSEINQLEIDYKSVLNEFYYGIDVTAPFRVKANKSDEVEALKSKLDIKRNQLQTLIQITQP